MNLGKAIVHKYLNKNRWAYVGFAQYPCKEKYWHIFNCIFRIFPFNIIEKMKVK